VHFARAIGVLADQHAQRCSFPKIPFLSKLNDLWNAFSAATMSQNTEQHSCKRVILLFNLNTADGDIMKVFLRYCHRPESECEENKHFLNLDPERDEKKPVHIVIDMKNEDFNDPDLSTLPHEIYKVKLAKSNEL
jgi:hypothetical protein